MSILTSLGLKKPAKNEFFTIDDQNGNTDLLDQLINARIEKAMIAHNLATENTNMVLGADVGPAIAQQFDMISNNIPLFYYGRIIATTTTNFVNEYQAKITYESIISQIIGQIQQGKNYYVLSNGGVFINDGSIIPKIMCNQSTLELSGSGNGEYYVYVVVIETQI